MSIYLKLKLFFIWLWHCGGNTVKEQRWILSPSAPRKVRWSLDSRDKKWCSKASLCYCMFLVTVSRPDAGHALLAAVCVQRPLGMVGTVILALAES